MGGIVGDPMNDKRPHEQKRQCGAKNRQGNPCGRPPRENGRCNLHGGKALRGVAVPELRAGGRYSKYLPTRLLERYHEAEADGDLLNLREDVALLDARLADLLKRVDSGESAGAWKRAKDAWKAFGRAPLEEKQKYHDELTDLLAFGQGDAEAWAELARLLQDRRRLVESERKRLVEMQQNITAEQAMVLLSVIVDIVRRHVADRTALAAISNELIQLSVQRAS